MHNRFRDTLDAILQTKPSIFFGIEDSVSFRTKVKNLAPQSAFRFLTVFEMTRKAARV